MHRGSFLAASAAGSQHITWKAETTGPWHLLSTSVLPASSLLTNAVKVPADYTQKAVKSLGWQQDLNVTIA